MATLLEERFGTSGQWVQISSGNSYHVAFNNKPDGTYFYRAVGLIPAHYGGPPIWSYGGVSSVVVNAGPPPPHDPITDQLRYGYETRVGDIDADGRQDVFVRRTSGGVPGNGALSEAILRRLPDGSFSPGVPLPSQAATAANWPVLNTKIELDDFNLDGFVDVLLPALDNAIAGALGQVIVSSGQIRTLAPQRAIPMDAKFDRFASDVGKWMNDSNHFLDNAPIVLVEIWDFIPVCDFPYGDYTGGCGYYYGIVDYYYVQDFSMFDGHAVLLSFSFNQYENGVLRPGIIPGSADGIRIHNLFQSVFGVPVLRGLLGRTCYDHNYDPIFNFRCIDYDAIGELLLRKLFKRKRDVPACRPLTNGEQFELFNMHILIPGVEEVRICNYAVQILGDVLDIPWVVLGGNIYVTSGWRDDYSLGPVVDRGNRNEALLLANLLRHLTYVYHMRSFFCDDTCMVYLHRKARDGRGPLYTPLETSVPFLCRNIQQQAEMIGDLNLKWVYQAARLPRNQELAPSLAELDAYVPVLGGMRTLPCVPGMIP